MANIAFMLTDRAAAGTASASAQVATLPASRILTASPLDVWRGPSGTTSGWVQVDFGAAVAIDVVALLGLQGTGTLQRRIRLSANSDMSSPGYDTTLAAPATGEHDSERHQLVHVLPSTVSRRYLRVDLSDAALAWLELGKLVAGPLDRMTRNHAHGLAWDSDDPSRVTRTPGGARYFDLREIGRILDLELPALTPAEDADFGHRLRTSVGASRCFLTVLDPAGSSVARDSVWGHLERAPRIARPNVAMRNVRLRIVERTG